MSYMNQEALERDVVNKIIDLEGAEDKDTLKIQFKNSIIKEREFTGVGFFTDFSIPKDSPKCKNMNIHIGDKVCAKINNLKDYVYFILFIRKGIIDFLECYSMGNEYCRK